MGFENTFLKTIFTIHIGWLSYLQFDLIVDSLSFILVLNNGTPIQMGNRDCLFNEKKGCFGRPGVDVMTSHDARFHWNDNNHIIVEKKAIGEIIILFIINLCIITNNYCTK